MSCQGPTQGQGTDEGKGERQANLATWICGDPLNIRNEDDVNN